MNKTGPRTLPCETPLQTLKKENKVLFTHIDWLLPLINAIRFKILFCIL